MAETATDAARQHTPQHTQRRLDRLELLIRSIRDDLAVKGVLFSRETDALFVEMAMARRANDAR